MNYKVEVKRSAEKELASLERKAAKRVARKLADLRMEPRPRGAKKLKGDFGYRIRVGSYRIIYTIDDENMFVMATRIRPRDRAY